VSVLILTASFGEGHNAAARNLREALVAADPALEVGVHDVFAEAYGPLNEAVRRAYLGAINRVPSLWAWCFEVLDKTPAVPAHIGIYRRAGRRIKDLLSRYRPRVVVSTYPGCNHLLDHVLRDRLHRDFLTATVITDSITIHTSWHTAVSDLYAVPNPDTADVLLARGIPREKITVTGFPVPRAFAGLRAEKPGIPAPGGAWKVLYMVNSAEHTATRIASSLLALDGVELTVTVGRNDRLGKSLAALPGAPTVHGWTPEMPRLMARSHFLVGKAGGATVQECLAAGTPIVISQVVPGQEEGNARLVVNHAAGAIAKSPADIPAILREATSQGGALYRRWAENAMALGTPDGATRLAGHLLDRLR